MDVGFGPNANSMDPAIPHISETGALSHGHAEKKEGQDHDKTSDRTVDVLQAKRNSFILSWSLKSPHAFLHDYRFHNI